MPSVVEQTPYNEYTGNGIATVYPYEFELLAEDDLVVYVDSTIIPSSDYTLAGVGVQAGGTVTFDTAPANGATVLLSREIALARDTDYQYNGDLPEATVDRDFNRLWQAIQGISAKITGALRLPYPEQADELPPPTERAGFLLGFDAVTGAVTMVTAAVGSALALALQLASSIGSSLIGFIQAGTGAVARTVQSKLRETVSVTDFGAVGDGIVDDTAAIMAAYAYAKSAGKELVLPPGVYAVTYVNFDGSDVVVRFEGNAILKGIASVPTYAVLEITCRQMVGYNFQVSQDFNSNYTSAVRWHSTSAGEPAQFNRIFGLKVSNCTLGLVYGDVVGGAPVNAPQSENTIFGLTTRACQIPFVGNQPNGFITLVSPVLDCNPNEWAAQPGYNATTYATNAYAFYNTGDNHLVILGGEVLKTYSTLGYGFRGFAVVSIGTTFEIAGTQGYIEGLFSITDTGPGFMTAGGVPSSSLPGFVIDDAATGIFTLRNFVLGRTAGSAAASSANFIVKNGGSPTLTCTIRDCNLPEWRWDTTVPLVSGVTIGYYDNNFLTVDSGACNTVKNRTAVGLSAATYTVVDGDLQFLGVHSATMTVTLPSAAAHKGRFLYFGTITAQAIVSASSNVIPLGSGATGTAICSAVSGKFATMQSDGGNWRILMAN